MLRIYPRPLFPTLAHLAPHENKIQHEHNGENVSQPARLASASAQKLDDRIADETKRQSVRDGIRKWNPDEREKGWDGFGVIAPVNLSHILHHHRPDDHERRCRDGRITPDHRDHRTEK